MCDFVREMFIYQPLVEMIRIRSFVVQNHCKIISRTKRMRYGTVCKLVETIIAGHSQI